MIDAIIRNKINIILFSFIFILTALPRLILLDILPSTITGDEVTNLSDVYKIIYNNKFYLFSFMGDGSVGGLNFYWMALFVKIIGIGNSIYGIRLSVVILSILSLIPFYILLRNRTSQFVAIVFSVLLSSNYVFLNFSRTAWINMGIIFSGLSLLLMLEKGEKDKKKIWYLLAGILAGITLYGYHYGRILVCSIILYLLFSFLHHNNRNLAYIKSVGIFLGITLIVFLPFLIPIISDRAESVLRRPKSTYIFSSKDITDLNLLQHQIEYALKGFILLDKSVMSQGVENQRYLPIHTSPVSLPIKALFILGLAHAIFFRRDLRFWWILFISTIFTQVITELPPNFSRGLFYIPFIYFICAILLNNIAEQIKNNIAPLYKFLVGGIILISIFIFIYDMKTYFMWMKTTDNYNARQPAIDYKEFTIWQNYQLERVKSGQDIINNYEWHDIKESIIKNQ